MTTKTTDILTSYFETALSVADYGKVSRLFDKLGYRMHGQITPAMCIDALQKHKGGFSVPFGKLVRAAMRTPKFTAMRSAAVVDKASGTGNGLEWFNSFTDFLIKSSGSVFDYLNLFENKENNELLAKSQYYYSQAELQRAQSNSTVTKVIIAALVGIIIIAGIILIARK